MSPQLGFHCSPGHGCFDHCGINRGLRPFPLCRAMAENRGINFQKFFGELPMAKHTRERAPLPVSSEQEPRGWSLSARLILLLTLLVGAVMALGGWYIQRQRVAILETATRNELRAHAATLQIALEGAYRDGRLDAGQRLINRLSETPKIYSVIVFDEHGQATMLSNPTALPSLRSAPAVQQVLTTGETVEFASDMELFSIVMPLRLSNGRRGAVEVSQPTSFIAADRGRARRDIAMIALALFAAIAAGVMLVMRYGLLHPLRELLGGVAALGSGEFDYRVIVPRGGHELTRLAQSFNQMAASLAWQRNEARRAAAHELELERKLRQSERLAVVGRISAGVAHELGAPLNVIKGRVGMVQVSGPALPEKQRRNLTIINAQVDAITHLVRQLLDLARPFHLQHEALDLRELAAGVCELVEADARKQGVQIELPLTDPVWVEGDRKFLHQVLLNLCLNGLQAMERNGGGVLRFTFAVSTDHATAAHIGRGMNGYTMLRLADTGPGIAPEHLEHIFDPFFTTKEVGKGTGLGLSVSRRIVEEHGGHIDAANGRQGGAVFTIWLPRAVAPQSPSAQAGENEAAAIMGADN
ncbi:MAG: ATP-binding protein [Blastocatellia bacterium]|nr:ATP-binding protein [Blastocatellia bacterium]